MVKIIVNGCSEEKKLSADEHNAKASEVESSAASIQKRRRQIIQADDESSPAPMEKQPLSDSGLNTSLSHDVSEDKRSEAPMKKQCVGDSYVSEDESSGASMKKQYLSDSYESYVFDAEKERKKQANSVRTFSDSEFEAIERCGGFSTDDDLLSWGRNSWRRGDRSRETYKLIVVASNCEESECIELLAKIGCEDRFLGCSVENPYAFYAQLSRKEAAAMQELKEIHLVTPLRLCVFDVV